MAAPGSRPFNIAVLISGGGTTLKNFIERIAAGRLQVTISLVISSSPKAGGLQFAHDAGIPSLIIEQKNFPDQETLAARFSAIVARRAPIWS
jgi:phosphoribosylglycinamide formyltransferase 1